MTNGLRNANHKVHASCNLHSDCPGEKQGAKIWKLYSLVSLHNTTCFVLADIKKSFRINTVKEVIVILVVLVVIVNGFIACLTMQSLEM